MNDQTTIASHHAPPPAGVEGRLALPPLFYAASFPGSGDKLITKYLIEKLTGLHVEDAATAATAATDTTVTEDGGKSQHSNARMVAIRTQFPHTSGQLVSLPPHEFLFGFAVETYARI